MMMLAIEPSGAVATFAEGRGGNFRNFQPIARVEPAGRDALLELRRDGDDRVAFRLARDAEIVSREVDLGAFAWRQPPRPRPGGRHAARGPHRAPQRDAFPRGARLPSP